MATAKRVILDSLYETVENYIFESAEYAERRAHIRSRHFLTREGVISRMKDEKKKIASAFLDTTFEDIEDMFLSIADSPEADEIFLFRGKKSGTTEFCFPGKGFSLEYRRGAYLEKPCTEVVLIVGWTTAIKNGKTIIDEVTLKTAYPVNDDVRREIALRGL